MSIWWTIWSAINSTWKVMADTGQEIAKGLVKLPFQVVDIAWDVIAQWADFAAWVAWWKTDFANKEWFIDKSVSKIKKWIDKQDSVKSWLDTMPWWEDVKKVIQWAAQTATVWWVLWELWLLKKWWDYYKIIKWKAFPIKKEAVKWIVTAAKTKKWLASWAINRKVTWKQKSSLRNNIIEIVKKHPYLSWVLTTLWIGLSAWWEENKQENVDSWSWVTIDTSSAKEQLNNKQQEEKEITHNDVVWVARTIQEKVNSWEMNKADAKKALITIQEYANSNFDTSIQDNLYSKWIDWSLANRAKIAKALWIEWYKWTYQQNVSMLEKIKFMSWRDINNLIVNS